MNLLFQHHLSYELEEALLTGSGYFPEKVLESLIIVSQKEFVINEFNIKLYILATSHCAVITKNGKSAVQILSCRSLNNFLNFEKINSFKINQIKSYINEFSFLGKNFTSKIEPLNLKNGIELFKNIKFKKEFSHNFPGDKNPVTLLGLLYDKNFISIHSLHTYPDEEISIYSKLSIKNPK
jgi:Protein of unknown function DUF2617